MQVAGITVTYDPTARREHRVKKILVAGSEIDPGRQYQVAMPLSLAKGGSGYFQIFDAGNIVRQHNTPIGQAIFDFAKAKGKVNYTGQGRLVEAR